MILLLLKIYSFILTFQPNYRIPEPSDAMLPSMIKRTYVWEHHDDRELRAIVTGNSWQSGRERNC